ncbi:MAG: intradiol ring-cleavage dioxygenase [Verrucomicrobia bacterium]|nr:intradiol ring-cleavage dioxygenase [Verrucomicrobiota bacterium]
MFGRVPRALSRRRFLYAVAAVTAPVAFLRSTFGQQEKKGTVDLQPTPAVGDDDRELTPEETAGPFFRPNSPAKSNFREPVVTGVAVNLSGLVLNQQGKPIAGSLLDFWHADADGQYDFDGFRCRGHQFADSGGRYSLQTIMPGLYPNRTRHYHVRLQSAHGPILSTQLYFPGEERNSVDFLFRRDLLLKVRGTRESWTATFNFVLKTS